MIALDRTLRTTFATNGIATISAFPERARDVWEVTRYQVHTTSLLGTECTVYRGSVVGSGIDFTRTGNDDTSEQFHELDVHFGQPLIFRWTGGSPGSVAEVTLLGVVTKR